MTGWGRVHVNSRNLISHGRRVLSRTLGNSGLAIFEG